MYLLIETGHEGIEALCSLSADKSTILQERKKFIAKKIKSEKELWKNERPALKRKMMPSKRAVADFFCVQHWDGEKFECVCAKLNVKPSRLMLR